MGIGDDIEWLAITAVPFIGSIISLLGVVFLYMRLAGADRGKDLGTAGEQKGTGDHMNKLSDILQRGAK